MSWLPPDDDEPYAQYDESDVRNRPNPHGTRPRSKRRPGHEDAVPGLVLAVDRGRFTVLLRAGADEERFITATRARELGRSSIVTGDRVGLVGDVSGEEGALARIVRVDPRETVLRRSADDSDTVERIVVANADQLLIVVAAADPEPRARLVDRYLVAAFDAGIRPILYISKVDLADPTPFLAEFAELDLEVITGTREAAPVEALRRRLAGHVTVAVGHSGVGKSTLVNALVPNAGRETGVVNSVTGRGRHTSSSTVALRVEDAQGRTGWIIDTPGVRSFGLGHVHPENVLRAFAALAHPVADPPDGVPLDQAHDWEIVDRVRGGELGESGRARVEALVEILQTLGAPVTDST